MCIAAVAAIAVAVAGAGYSVYSSEQQKKAADKARKDAKAALNAQQQLSGEQWAHYRDTYRPMLTGLVDFSKKDEYAGNIEGSIAGMARQEQGLTGSGLTAAGAGQGLDPSQFKVSSSLAQLGGLTGAETAQRLASVRPSLEDTAWNRRVGFVQVGRGLPGQIESGYGALAGQYGQDAAQKYQQSAQSAQAAGQFAGMGLGATGKMV